MTPIREKQTRPCLGGRYKISSDGFLIIVHTDRGSYVGRAVMPQWKAGWPQYFVNIDGRQKTRRIHDLVREVWKKEITVTREDVLYMRRCVDEHNAQIVAAVELAKKQPSAGVEKKMARATTGVHMPPKTTECTFPEMDHFPPGIKTYDCPEMDPMSCGTWWVRIDMSDVETKNERKAA